MLGNEHSSMSSLSFAAARHTITCKQRESEKRPPPSWLWAHNHHTREGYSLIATHICLTKYLYSWEPRSWHHVRSARGWSRCRATSAWQQTPRIPWVYKVPSTSEHEDKVGLPLAQYRPQLSLLFILGTRATSWSRFYPPNSLSL